MEQANLSLLTRVRRHPKRVALILIIALLGLFLGLLPVGIKYVVLHQLAAQGVAGAQLDNIDLNLFNGTVAIDGLMIPAQADQSEQATTPKPAVSIEHLSLTLSLSALLDKRVHLESLLLKNARFLIEDLAEQGIRIGLLIPPADTPSEEPNETPGEWQIGIGQLTLQQTEIEYQAKQLSTTLSLETISLSQLLQWAPETASELKAKGTLNGSEFTIDTTAYTFKLDQPSQATLSLNNIDLAPFASLLQTAEKTTDQTTTNTSNSIERLEGKLSLNLTVTLSEIDAEAALGANKGSFNIKVEGKLGLMNPGLTLTQPTDTLELDSTQIAWQGEMALILSPEQTVNLNSSDQLSIKHLLLQTKTANLALESFGWTGKTQLNSADLNNSLQIQGNSAINALKVTQSTATTPEESDADQDTPTKDITLLTLDRLGLKHFELQTLNAMSLENLTIDAITTFEVAAAPLATLQQLQVSDVQITNLHQATIQSIALNGLTTQLKRNEAGEIETFTPPQTASDHAAPDNATPATKTPDGVADNEQPDVAEKQSIEASTPFTLLIEQFELDNQSALAFTDASVSPQFNTTIAINHLRATNISNRPDATPIHLSTEMTIDEFSTLTANGTVTPFAKMPAAAFDIALQNYNLAPISPYLVDATGYNVNSGQFNTQSRVNIEIQKINNENDILLQRLKLKPADKEKINQLTTQLTMPLDTALSTLQDSNGDIKLMIPVTGDLNNPEIHYDDILKTAMQQAVKSASLSYLKQALQPYGALLTAYSAANKLRKSIPLDTIEYQPDQVNLTTEDQAKLEKIAKILSEKPSLSMKLCSFYTQADKAYWEQHQTKQNAPSTDNLKESSQPASDNKNEQATDNTNSETVDQETWLINTSQKRATQIKTHLIKTLGASPSQLLVCQPEWDEDAEAKSRVEILL